jgi:DNA-binding transcriptional LysR family regulator
MRGLHPDHLEAFRLVTELGSFSAAAERLGLTQPAVSLQVRQLEQRVGVRLLDRVGRRATPTAAGSEMLPHVRRIGEAMDGALSAMAAYSSGTAGRVRLGTGATACIYLLPPILRALRTRFPALEIVVSTGNTPDMLRAVENNALDVALVTLPAPGRMFQVTPIVDDPFVAVFPAAEAPAEGPVTPAQLSQRPLVLYEPGANTRTLVDHWFRKAGHVPKPVMELGSVEAIKELVGAGLGCTILPAMSVPAKRQRAPIVPLPLSPRLNRKLALVLRRDKPLQRGLREVIAALKRPA